MKETIEKNEKRIDFLQDRLKKLKQKHTEFSEYIGGLCDELSRLQSQNSVMRIEMQSGKSIEEYLATPEDETE